MLFLIPSEPDRVPDTIRQVLTLLTRNQVLLTVTLRLEVAERPYLIIISKQVGESGQVLPGFRWEVDSLADEEWRRTSGLQPYETGEGAYTEAVAWVQAHAQTD